MMTDPRVRGDAVIWNLFRRAPTVHTEVSQ